MCRRQSLDIRRSLSECNAVIAVRGNAGDDGDRSQTRQKAQRRVRSGSIKYGSSNVRKSPHEPKSASVSVSADSIASAGMRQCWMLKVKWKFDRDDVQVYTDHPRLWLVFIRGQLRLRMTCRSGSR